MAKSPVLRIDIEQVFSMPGAEERYQAWLKERRAKQKRTARAAR